MSVQPRSRWVDFARGVAIMAVVLLHIDFPLFDSTTPPLREFLGGAWHVAVFFMLAGFFLKEERLIGVKDFIKNKLKYLYLPILYFYVPAVLLQGAMQAWGWYDVQADYADKLIIPFTLPLIVKHLLLSVCLAGREPILGAMWFAYVLFMALCALSFISYLLKKICHSQEQYDGGKWLTLLVLALGASSLSNQWGISIPRFNNVFTAMWLVHCGYWLRNRAKFEFNNTYVLAASVMVFVHLIYNEGVFIALNSNKFTDLVSLTAIATCALYAICYVGRKLDGSFVGNVISYVGRESFYVMALQFVGFKLAVYLLKLFGASTNIGALQPETGGSIINLLVFFTCGVAFPCAFMWVFRKLKARILGLTTRQ